MIPLRNPWQNHSGASHRKNFDTPPLKGSCRYTKVNLHKTRTIHHCWYTQVYRPESSNMLLATGRNGSSKTVFRNTTRCLKLTHDEARLLDQTAEAKGIPRSEWMREVILRELRSEPLDDGSLAEILGIRLLLVNVLRPLAAGQRLTSEAFDKLLDEIGTAKHQLADKLTCEKRR